MNKAVVTGALGFIGYHLCQRLLEEGVEVIGIDACIDSKRKEIQEEMLHHFGRNAQFHFIRENLLHVRFAEFMHDVDTVFHLANSRETVRTSQHVSKKIETALAVTNKVIEACVDRNTAIVYTSSLEVYGNRFGKITETSPVSPETPLGLLKVADEALLSQKTKKANIPLLIMRLPHVFGPWQHPESLFSRLILTQLKGKTENNVELKTCPIENFMYIDDVTKALWLASNHCFTYDIYNLASEERNQGQRVIEWLLEKPIDRKWTSERMSRSFSAEKAANNLNFRASHSLEGGLHAYREHVKKMMQHHPTWFADKK